MAHPVGVSLLQVPNDGGGLLQVPSSTGQPPTIIEEDPPSTIGRSKSVKALSADFGNAPLLRRALSTCASRRTSTRVPQGQGAVNPAVNPALKQWLKLVSAVGTPNMEDEDDTNDIRLQWGRRNTSPSADDLMFIKKFSPRNVTHEQERSKESPWIVRKFESYRRFRRTGVRTQQRGKRDTVVEPDGTVIFYWLGFLSIAVTYCWWSLIVRCCVDRVDEIYYPVFRALDILTDLVYFSDVIVQLNTGYLQQGLVVKNKAKILCTYMYSRRFLIDVLATLPIDRVVTSDYRIAARFVRLIKISRPLKFYYMVESRTHYPNLIRVTNLCHILLLLCHWFACFYYLLGKNGYAGYEFTEWNTSNMSTTDLYLHCLYWSCLTLTTIGNGMRPVTNQEFCFTILSYLCGVFIFATIVGQVGNVISNRNHSRLEFERLLDSAKSYMSLHSVPKDMQRRVQRWYDYSWSRGRMAGGTTQALSVLPDKLKTELALHVNLNTLKRVSFFQECQPEFLRDLVLKMKAIIFTPGDYICRIGEISREMFIIADGVLEVENEKGEIVRTLKAGEFFGEIGILNLTAAGTNKRSADVRSVGYSELFSLSREDMLAALMDYPEAEALLRTYGQRRLCGETIDEIEAKPKQNNSSASVRFPVAQHFKRRFSHESTWGKSTRLSSEKKPPSTNPQDNFKNASMKQLTMKLSRRPASFRLHRQPKEKEVTNERLANERKFSRETHPSYVTNLLGCVVERKDDSMKGGKGQAQSKSSLTTGRMNSLDSGRGPGAIVSFQEPITPKVSVPSPKQSSQRPRLAMTCRSVSISQDIPTPVVTQHSTTSVDTDIPPEPFLPAVVIDKADSPSSNVLRAIDQLCEYISPRLKAEFLMQLKSYDHKLRNAINRMELELVLKENELARLRGEITSLNVDVQILREQNERSRNVRLENRGMYR